VLVDASPGDMMWFLLCMLQKNKRNHWI